VSGDLDALYAQVPAMVGCDGSCWESCGPVPMGPAERDRIAAAGVDMPSPATLLREDRMCPALSAFGRCTVYAARPMLCRLWGAVPEMPCPRGCRPVGGFLPSAEGRRLLGLAMKAT
jgi:hypothetical protein